MHEEAVIMPPNSLLYASIESTLQKILYETANELTDWIVSQFQTVHFICFPGADF
jgi:hypothetical protein